MFDLKRGQLEDLARRSQSAFHADLAHRLSPWFCDPVRRLSDSALRDAMHTWHTRGLTYGMDTERSMGRFLGVHLTVLPNFDKHEPLSKFLETNVMSGDQKMTALFVRLRELLGS